MRRFATFALVLALLGGVVGCGGAAPESYKAAVSTWEACSAQAPVGAREPASCLHLAATTCAAAKREHLKGTGTGLACEVERTVVITPAQLRAALPRCLAAWNETAGPAKLAAVAESAYRSHAAAVAVYTGEETTYIEQAGTGLTAKTADIAVSPGACIVGVFGPRRGFILSTVESVFVQQQGGSWLQANSIHPEGASNAEQWATTQANVSAVSVVTVNGVSGGTLSASVGAQIINLPAGALHGKDYAEALEDEKEHHDEAKPSAAECSECQPSASEAQTLPRPVGYSAERFAQEKATLAETKAHEHAEQEAKEAKVEANLNKICSEGEAGNAECTEGIERCQHSSSCSKKYGLKYEPGRKEPSYPAHW